MQEYANSRDQWPDERWKSYDGAPPDEARCQHEMYGEMRCGPALGKALAAMEVVIGVFCMSLFLVTVTRRWSR